MITYYGYASVMKARNSAADIESGDVHIMDGKKDETEKETYLDGQEVRTVMWDRLKVIELPREMDSHEIKNHLNANFDEYLGDIEV